MPENLIQVSSGNVFVADGIYLRIFCDCAVTYFSLLYLWRGCRSIKFLLSAYSVTSTCRHAHFPVTGRGGRGGVVTLNDVLFYEVKVSQFDNSCININYSEFKVC
jgi:hypothetical protein